MALTSVGEIVLDVKANTASFEKSLSGAEKNAKSFSSKISGNFDEAAASSRTFAKGLLAAGAAIGGIVGFGVKVAADLESARQGFVSLLGSAEAADKTMADIKEAAKKTPFELPGLTTATQMLTSVTKDGDRALDFVLDFGEGLAALGKGEAELSRLSVNLQGIAALGRAQMIDIKQFAFAGVPIFDMLTEATGKTGDALDEFINDGGVTFEFLEQMFKDATDEGGRFFGAFETQSGTFNQLMSNMKDGVQIFLSDTVKATGIFGALKDAISSVISFLENNTDAINEAVVTGLTWIKDNGAVVAGVIGGALVPMMIALAGSVWGVLAPLIPFMAAGAAIGIVVKKLVDRFGGWQGLLDAIAPKLETLKDFGLEVWDVMLKLNEAMQPIRDIFMEWWQVFKDNMLPILEEFWANHGEKVITILKGIGIAMAAIVFGPQILLSAALMGLIVLLTKVSTWLMKAQTFMIELKDKGVQKLGEAWTWLKERTMEMWETITFVFTNFPQIVAHAIGFVIGKLARFAIDAPDKIRQLKDRVVAFFKEAWAKAKEMTLNGVLAVVSFMVSLPTRTISALTRFKDLIVNKFNEIKDAGKNKIKDMIDGIVDFFLGLPGRISGAIDSAKEKVKSFASDTIGNVAGGFIDGFRAEGGPVRAGQGYVVGERGPELFFPNSSGAVVSNDQVLSALESQQSAPVTITNNVQLNSEAAVEAFERKMNQKEIASKFGASLA